MKVLSRARLTLLTDKSADVNCKYAYDREKQIVNLCNQIKRVAKVILIKSN